MHFIDLPQIRCSFVFVFPKKNIVNVCFDAVKVTGMTELLLDSVSEPNKPWIRHSYDIYGTLLIIVNSA